VLDKLAIGLVFALQVGLGFIAGCGGDERVGLVQDDDDAPDVAESLFEVDDVSEEVDAAPEVDTAIEETRAEVVEDVKPEVEVVPDVEIDCGDCDDLLACTNDVCGPDGVCVHNVKAGFCKVAGACVESGNGPAECRICAPDINPNGLTSLTGGPCDDGDPCTTDEQCTLGTCTGGIVRACDDVPVCYQNLGCDAVLGCVSRALLEGTPCGSGSACEAVASDVDGLPPEVDAVQCVAGDGMPPGSIAWFDALRCPGGWEQYAPATGRTLVPLGPLGPDKGVIEDGTPYLSGANPTHAHSIAGTANIGTQRFVGVAGGGNGLANPGTVAVTGSSDAVSLGLPYVQLLACKKTSDHVLGVAPAGVFVFADAALGCGADWVASDEGSLRLVVATPTDGTTGATFGAPPGLSARASHTHGVNGFFAVDSHGVALASGCCSPDFASSSDPLVDYPSSAQTNNDSTTFPWRGELQCMLADPAVPAPTADTAPPGIVLFANDDSCPVGWNPLEFARGRIIVGAATGGDVHVVVGSPLRDREDRTHRHTFTLQLSLSQKNIAAANGPNQDGAAPGTHDATLAGATATSGLPFRQLLACTKP